MVSILLPFLYMDSGVILDESHSMAASYTSTFLPSFLPTIYGLYNRLPCMNIWSLCITTIWPPVWVSSQGGAKWKAAASQQLVIVASYFLSSYLARQPCRS